MKNWIVLGPVRIRIGSKNLAPWGWDRFAIYGFSMFSWTNTGGLILASYMPKGECWHWSIGIHRREHGRGWISRDKHRRGQWHDYYWLPFGFEVIHSQQDWHKTRPLSNGDRG